uniref:Uncharacterized protein n=1 Tax=Tetranychus urticae TaxID=32264 RepID=T1K593_TETUR
MALIDELPDDILLKIFISSSPRMKHAVSISNVCQRWNQLMKARFSLVKYLVYYYDDLYMSRFFRIDEESDDDGNEANHIINDALEAVIERVVGNEPSDEQGIEGNLVEENVNQLNIQHESDCEQCQAERVDPSGRYLCIDVDEDELEIQQKYIELLPNLMFLTVNAPSNPDDEQSLINLINSKSNIKGVDWHPSEEKRDGPPKIPLKNIDSVTQLYCYDDQLSIIEAVTQCPHLRRLHCYQLNQEAKKISPLRKYRGPVLTNLEVLEISLGSKWNPRDLKNFIQFTPNLKSLFIQLARPPIITFTRSSKLFPQVENLILEMSATRKLSGKIERFEGLISMFPNLKNLGLRYFRIYTEDQLYHSLRRLPLLELVDIREWSMSIIDQIYGVAELNMPFESVLNPNKIEIWYQNLFDHPIHCCIHNLTEEEPTLYYDGFVDGFNFMHHIFNKDFQKIPNFMIE